MHSASHATSRSMQYRNTVFKTSPPSKPHLWLRTVTNAGRDHYVIRKKMLRAQVDPANSIAPCGSSLRTCSLDVSPQFAGQLLLVP